MTFLDKAHARFFETMIQVEHCEEDTYRQAFFYTLGLTVETREHVRDLYDFNMHRMILSGLRKPWHTSESSQVTRLALNLGCGYVGHDGIPPEDFAPYRLFDADKLPLMLEAVKIRFPKRANE